MYQHHSHHIVFHRHRIKTNRCLRLIAIVNQNTSYTHPKEASTVASRPHRPPPTTTDRPPENSLEQYSSHRRRFIHLHVWSTARNKIAAIRSKQDKEPFASLSQPLQKHSHQNHTL